MVLSWSPGPCPDDVVTVLTSVTLQCQNVLQVIRTSLHRSSSRLCEIVSTERNVATLESLVGQISEMAGSAYRLEVPQTSRVRVIGQPEDSLDIGADLED
jgi:hypothetical protein